MEEFVAALTRCMEKGISDKVFPGAVLLCARGETILYHRAFGLADLSSRKPVTTDAIFDLASLTKPLATALLACVLVQDGKLSLKTCLGDVLHHLVPASKASITMDMLLRHTSGLPAYKPFFMEISHEEKSGRDSLRTLVMAEPLEAAPGTRQQYSDLGYILLAWVLEEITGLGLDQAVRKKLHEPLGVGNLFFMDVPSSREKLSSRLFVSNQDCPWRKKIITGEVDDENAWVAGGIEGHAGLFGDAVSVYVMCREILNTLKGREDTLFDPLVLQRFVQKYPGQEMVAGFDTPRISGSSAGSHVSSLAIGHLGFTGTSFWIDPDSELVAVLLTNRTHPSRSNEKIKEFRPVIHDCIFSAF